MFSVTGGGNIFFTHTDNSTYVAGTVCISEYSDKLRLTLDRENFWWIMETSKTPALPATIEKIKKEFFAMGFKNNTAVEKVSPLFVHKLTAHPSNC